MTKDDKKIELERYDNRAISVLSKEISHQKGGALLYPLYVRSPYILYESHIKKHIDSKSIVLELGTGDGAFTEPLLQSGAKVVVSDISYYSLLLTKGKFKDYQNLSSVCCDMSILPFRSGSIDVVVSAGALSYGDNQLVLNEISRITKCGGLFICVDSLNHNPIYRLNRLFHYLRGKRTASTLKRMPTTQLFDDYKIFFEDIDINYFGSIVWLAPLLKLFIGDVLTAKIIDFFDEVFKTKMSAFKFVMVAKRKA